MISLIAWLLFGALIGGFLFQRDVTASVFNIGSVLTALIGAVILLAIVNMFTRGRVR